MDLQKKKRRINSSVNSLQFKSKAHVTTSPLVSPIFSHLSLIPPAPTSSIRNPVIAYKQTKSSPLCQKTPNRLEVPTSTSMSPISHICSAQPSASTTSTRTRAQSTQQSLPSNSSSTTTRARNHSSQQFNPISTRTRSTQPSTSTITHFSNKTKTAHQSPPSSTVPLSGMQTPTPTCICGEFTHKRISNKMCKYYPKYLIRKRRVGEEREREQKGKGKEEAPKSKCLQSVDERLSDNKRAKYNSVEEEIRGEKRKRERIRRKQKKIMSGSNNNNKNNTRKYEDLSEAEEKEYQSDLLEEEENYVMEEIMEERAQNGVGSPSHIGHEDEEEPLIRRRRQHRQNSPHDVHGCQLMVN